MQRLAHARRLRARNELAKQDDALGVGRPLRRLLGGRRARRTVLGVRRVERNGERFAGRGPRGLPRVFSAVLRLNDPFPPSYGPMPANSMSAKCHKRTSQTVTSAV